MTSEELQDVAMNLFAYLIKEVEGPQDAAEVIFYLHIKLWKSQEATTSAEVMLDTFKALFLEALNEGPGLQ